MGFFEKVRQALSLPALAAGSLEVPYASAWADPNHLITVGTPDLLPESITRDVAMNVAALARARRIIVSSIARCPLVVHDDDGPLPDQPAWVSGTSGPISPYHRMLWTVDDLLFYGWSLWAVKRNGAGAVVAADHVLYERWGFTPNGEVYFEGEEIAPEDIILIPGSDQGILRYPAAIRHAAQINAAAASAAANPVAHTELHQTGGEPITDPVKIERLIEAWNRGRNRPGGSVGFTNSSIEAKSHGSFEAHLLVEGRNAAAIDIARVCGIPAILLDASLADSSIRYSNMDARNVELVDYCLASFMAPIAARLGMDDVVAPGQSVEFDLDHLTRLDPNSIAPPDDAHRPRPTPATNELTKLIN